MLYREDFSTEVSNWYFNYRVKFKQWPEEVQDYLDPEKNGQNMPEVSDSIRYYMAWLELCHHHSRRCIRSLLDNMCVLTR